MGFLIFIAIVIAFILVCLAVPGFLIAIAQLLVGVDSHAHRREYQTIEVEEASMK